MELSVREWMMIVGVLLIVAVLLDGYRRVRNERRNRIRVSLSKQAYQQHQYDDEDVEDEDARTVSYELPNGGARVIGKRRNDLKLDEPVPMLMDSVRLGREPARPAKPPVIEPDVVPEPPQDEDLWQETAAEYADEPEPATEYPEHQYTQAPAREEPAAEPARQEPLWETEAQQHYERQHNEEPAPAQKPARQREPIKQSEPSAAELNPAPQEVLVINVISKDKGGFRGPDLLQILLACDLRFGKMNIFHRYEKSGGRGQVQFSVANLVEPGIFSLDAIDSFSTPGVCFFLALPGPEAPIRAFDYMVETAQAVVRNLNAELRDEAHSVITTQTLEHSRQRIRDFERKQLTLHV